MSCEILCHGDSTGPGPASLPASELHVWRLSIEQPPDRLRAFQEILSPDERQRCRRIGRELERTSFVVCRGFLRMLLGRYRGLAPGEARLESGAYGKPSLDPGVRGSDIQFNVSHSGGVCLIALASGRPLGVDVEALGDGASADLISGGFFSAEEHRSIRALPEELRAAGFYRCWTRKEATIKAIGGSMAKLGREVIVSTDPREPARILQMPAGVEIGAWHVCDLPAGEGYAAALCYGGEPAAIFLWQERACYDAAGGGEGLLPAWREYTW